MRERWQHLIAELIPWFVGAFLLIDGDFLELTRPRIKDDLTRIRALICGPTMWIREDLVRRRTSSRDDPADCFEQKAVAVPGVLSFLKEQAAFQASLQGRACHDRADLRPC